MCKCVTQRQGLTQETPREVTLIAVMTISNSSAILLCALHMNSPGSEASSEELSPLMISEPVEQF